MKQMKFLLVAILSLLMTNCVMADDKPIPAASLPAAAKTFVNTHFKGDKIVYAEKDWDSYECRLNSGAKVEFNRKGVWQKVESKNGNAVPAALVPQAIKAYVKANYPDMTIIKIEKERYGYDIELSNDMDLKFNKKGELVGMDD